jgi:hypothetical protein
MTSEPAFCHISLLLISFVVSKGSDVPRSRGSSQIISVKSSENEIDLFFMSDRSRRE